MTEPGAPPARFSFFKAGGDQSLFFFHHGKKGQSHSRLPRTGDQSSGPNSPMGSRMFVIRNRRQALFRQKNCTFRLAIVARLEDGEVVFKKMPRGRHSQLTKCRHLAVWQLVGGSGTAYLKGTHPAIGISARAYDAGKALAEHKVRRQPFIVLVSTPEIRKTFTPSSPAPGPAFRSFGSPTLVINCSAGLSLAGWIFLLGCEPECR